MFVLCFVIITIATSVWSRMEGFIVGNSFADIRQYPYSAVLGIICVDNDRVVYGSCGASVLNQKLLITAGHCLHNCNSRGSHVSISLGHTNREDGLLRSSQGFIIHERYDPQFLSNDIAMIKMIPGVTFSSKISRVAIMKSPPYNEPAWVAGWGLVDDENVSKNLKQVDQTVWPHTYCESKFPRLLNVPVGTICASSKNINHYPSQGDSGSALVVRGYIQIGLVSFKSPFVSKYLIIYTDIGYFYDWIQRNARMLYCL